MEVIFEALLYFIFELSLEISAEIIGEIAEHALSEKITTFLKNFY